MANKKINYGFRDFIRATYTEPELLVRLIEQSEDIITFKMPIIKKPLHIFARPSFIKHIFFTNPQNYIKPPQIYYAVRQALGPMGLLGLVAPQDYPIWKKDRAALSKLFSNENLQVYSKDMVSVIGAQLDSWKSIADQKSVIKPSDNFLKITLLSILNTLFGGADPTLEPAFSLPELLRLGTPLKFQLVKLFGKIPMPLYFRYQHVRKPIVNMANYIVKCAFDSNKSHNNLIRCLASAYGYNSYDQLDKQMKGHLRDETITFLSAGVDTVAATLVNICAFLSLYPLIADKIYEEINTVLGKREPNYSDIEKLNYTRAVIKETLRLWPPGLAMPRMALNDDIIEGFAINKGDNIYIPVYANHRLSKYWPNPEGFDPSRFMQPLTEDQQILYSPFFVGERSCIGGPFAMVEATLLLVMLAQRYRLTLVPGCTTERESDMATLRMNTDILMNVHPIS